MEIEFNPEVELRVPGTHRNLLLVRQATRDGEPVCLLKLEGPAQPPQQLLTRVPIGDFMRAIEDFLNGTGSGEPLYIGAASGIKLMRAQGAEKPLLRLRLSPISEYPDHVIEIEDRRLLSLLSDTLALCVRDADHWHRSQRQQHNERLGQQKPAQASLPAAPQPTATHADPAAPAPPATSYGAPTHARPH